MNRVNLFTPMPICSHARIKFLSTALMLCALVSLSSGSPSDAMNLRSAEEHHGAMDWQMAPISAAGTNGAAISRPGITGEHWSPAIVPGTVLGSLVANGVYPEPYFGTNNAHEAKLIPDISEVGRDFYTYWFRAPLAVPPSYAGQRIWLQFDGINYRAEIWLNGTKLGDLAGMFQRGRFDITDIALVGQTNWLAVLVRPVDFPGGFKMKGAGKPRATGENRNGGNGQIGRNTTMLMTAGWDFTFTDGIRDRNTGIWRDVKIFATGPVALRNAFVQTKLPLPDTSSATLKISVDAINATAGPQTGTLRLFIPQLNLTLEKAVELKAGETRQIIFTPEEFSGLEVQHPRLWWPLNKGEPFLHDLQLSFVQGKEVSDRLTTRFGIREITSDRNTPDHSRMFYVNGQRLFLHGDNWVPEAMCRNSDVRTRAELRYTKQAGINLLRLWGGGIAESDCFFDTCDELGILVWMEFWQTGDTQLPQDRNLYRANVTDTILRLRNHASLAYYVSANERPGAPSTNVDPKLIVPIKDIIDELDPTHGWQQSSEVAGVHDGSPYKCVNPMWYYEDTASTRGSRVNGLCPEYGCPILPTIDCLREMMPAGDLWPINTNVWNYLDGGGFHEMTTTYREAVNQYGPSQSIEEYAWKSQMFGAVAYRSIWEVWNYNRYDYGDRFTSGLLFWYHNSPNPQVCGRLYDWSLEPTAALYYSQNANQPLHAQYDFIKNTVSVNNEFLRAFTNYQVKIRIFNSDMKEAYQASARINLPADGVANDVIKVTLPENLSPVHFIRLDLTDADGRPVAKTFYWRSTQSYRPGRTLTGPLYGGFEAINSLPRVSLETTITQTSEAGKNFYHATVTNPTKHLAFMVWLRLQDAATSKPVRPAFYDDNFFSLLPGESRQITIEYSGDLKPPATQLIVDGWNVKSQIFKP
jgi:mannosylglycoprotein endo-beta-mannosidase